MATYLPSTYINNNYRYTLSNGRYTIHTNNNCYSQYNTTYCDCIDIYPNQDYITSETYTCNYSPSTYISANSFTSDVWYRIDIPYILIIFTILWFFCFYFPFRIIQRFFGRWLKL